MMLDQTAEGFEIKSLDGSASCFVAIRFGNAWIENLKGSGDVGAMAQVVAQVRALASRYELYAGVMCEAPNRDRLLKAYKRIFGAKEYMTVVKV